MLLSAAAAALYNSQSVGKKSNATLIRNATPTGAQGSNEHLKGVTPRINYIDSP